MSLFQIILFNGKTFLVLGLLMEVHRQQVNHFEYIYGLFNFDQAYL